MKHEYLFNRPVLTTREALAKVEDELAAYRRGHNNLTQVNLTPLEQRAEHLRNRLKEEGRK